MPGKFCIHLTLTSGFLDTMINQSSEKPNFHRLNSSLNKEAQMTVYSKMAVDMYV